MQRDARRRADLQRRCSARYALADGREGREELRGELVQLVGERVDRGAAGDEPGGEPRGGVELDGASGGLMPRYRPVATKVLGLVGHGLQRAELVRFRG